MEEGKTEYIDIREIFKKVGTKKENFDYGWSNNKENMIKQSKELDKFWNGK